MNKLRPPTPNQPQVNDCVFIRQRKCRPSASTEKIPTMTAN